MRTFNNVYYAITIIGLSMGLAYWIAYFTGIEIVLLVSTLLCILSIILATIDFIEIAKCRKKAKKRKKKKAPLV